MHFLMGEDAGGTGTATRSATLAPRGKEDRGDQPVAVMQQVEPEDLADRSADWNVFRTSAKPLHSAALATLYQLSASVSVSGCFAIIFRRPRLPWLTS